MELNTLKSNITHLKKVLESLSNERDEKGSKTSTGVLLGYGAISSTLKWLEGDLAEAEEKITQKNAHEIKSINRQIADLNIDPDMIPDQATLNKWRILEEKLKKYSHEDHLAHLKLVGSDYAV